MAACKQIAVGGSPGGHAEPVIAQGDFTMLWPHDPAVYAFTRSLDATCCSCLCQPLRDGRDPTWAAVPEAAAWTGAQLLTGNYPDAPPETVLRP